MLHNGNLELLALKSHCRTTRPTSVVCDGILESFAWAECVDYSLGLVLVVLIVLGGIHDSLLDRLNILADDAGAVPNLDFRHFGGVEFLVCLLGRK